MSSAAGAGLGAAEREALEAARAEIYRLCEGGQWRMTVPVNERRDSDMILMAALDLLADRLAAADRDAGLRAKVAELCDLAETQVSMSMAVTIDGSPMFRAQVSAEALRAALDAS